MSFIDRIAAATGRAAVKVLDLAGIHIDYDFYSPDGREDVYRRNAEHMEAYFSNAYRACAMAKARPLAALPIHAYMRSGDIRTPATRRAAKDLETLLRTKWNPFMSSQEGIRWLDMTKDLKGEAFVRVEWVNGRIVHLWPLSGTPSVEILPGGSPAFTYGGDKFTPAGRYLEYEMVWVKSPILDSDCLHGKSLAAYAAAEIDMSIELEAFYSNILNGEGNFPGWLETDRSLKEQDFQRIVKQLSDGSGIVNSGKVRIFDNGLTYKQVNKSAADMSLVEQEKWILQQTCRTLSVPPQEVFDLSHATYSNIEQGAINFANKTLVPECAEIERAFSNIFWCLGITDHYIQFDMNGLLRGSYKERMEGYSIAIDKRIMSPNEARAKEDLPPYKGGEKFQIQSSYNLIDPVTGELQVVAPTNARQQEKQERDPIHDDMAARVRARYEERGDTREFRDFAVKVLKPYANAMLIARRDYDLDSDIERIIQDVRH